MRAPHRQQEVNDLSTEYANKMYLRRQPLRSRSGCATCRSRRKKCDETKPVCGACTRLGLSCTWSKHEAEQARSTMLRSRHPPQQVLHTTQRPNEVDLSGFQDDICISFTLDNLFKGVNRPIDPTTPIECLSFSSQTQFAEPNRSKSWTSLRALGLVYFGLRNGTDATTQVGFRVHSEALKSINHSIATKEGLYCGDTISAVAIASLFTMMIPKYAGAWTSHSLGIASIARAMGPDAFRPVTMRRLLENNRLAMIAAASVRKERTFFSEPEWLTVPWTDGGKSDFQRLLDVYALVPEVNVLFVELAVASPSQTAELAGRIAAKLFTILERLHEWRQSVSDKIRREIHELDQASGSMRAAGISRGAVGFQDVSTAFELGVFNMIIIVACGYLSALRPPQEEPPPSADVKPAEAGSQAPSQPRSPPSSALHDDDKNDNDREDDDTDNFNEDDSKAGSSGQVEDDGDKSDEGGKGDDSNGHLEAQVIPCEDPKLRAARAGEEIAQLVPWATQDCYLGGGALYLFAPATVGYHFFAAHDPAKAQWFATALKRLGSVWESLGTRGVQSLKSTPEGQVPRMSPSQVDHAEVSDY